ncbi:peptidoglycan recognition protein family protein [Streptomyces roseolilacinus]|uniref:peptidoglycan recognition protein family protein n=1 Tax=Streptomyces roseolilacinus TaxID=66904 RepID=UPI003819C009
MRSIRVPLIGVAVAVATASGSALALPLPLSASAVAAPAAGDAPDPGSTRSLPLVPLPDGERSAAPGTRAAQGLPRRDVEPFSLVGVVWEEPDTELHGTVQVRTRSTTTGAWSAWQDLETHQRDHAADPGTAEARSGAVRGGTAPLWVGDSDGVEVRVRPEAPDERGAAAPALPRGLRVELVHPGGGPAGGAQPPQDPRDAPHDDAPQVDPDPDADVDEPADEDTDTTDPGGEEDGTADPADEETGADEDTGEGTGTTDPADEGPAEPVNSGQGAVLLSAEESAASAVNADLVALGAVEIPELSKTETEEDLPSTTAAKPYIGPRPRIVTRKGWGADEKLREANFLYSKSVQAAFVHHSATGNNYTCAQAPSVLRGIYRYHVQSMGWRDLGYNFAIDKCGTVYEGRAGGVAKPVQGAHTLGFNSNTTGIAVLGSFSSAAPPTKAVTAVSKLTAWKLGLYGKNPRGKSTLTSGGGNLYKKGTKVQLNTISGHRDGYSTACPGAKLYGKLGTIRSTAAGYQGRP